MSNLLRALNRNGTLVPNGGQFYKRWFASSGVLLIKAPLLSLFVPQRIRVCTEHLGQNDLLVLKELMESGKLTPIVGRTYPLSRAHDAISYFGEGHAEGKACTRTSTSPSFTTGLAMSLSSRTSGEPYSPCTTAFKAPPPMRSPSCRPRGLRLAPRLRSCAASKRTRRSAPCTRLLRSRRTRSAA